jgi:hypothetical protein
MPMISTPAGVSSRAFMPAELISRITLSLIRDADKNHIAARCTSRAIPS